MIQFKDSMDEIRWVIARYGPGIEVAQITLHTCLKCGAQVRDSDLELHDSWHADLNARTARTTRCD